MTINIQQHADQSFLNCSREELKAILTELDVQLGKGNHSEEKMREAACAAVGKPFTPRATSDKPLYEGVPPKEGRLGKIANANWFRRMPRLMPQAGWEGKRRIVQLQETENLKAGTVAVVTWDGWPVEIQPGHQVKISYPHYEALKNSYVSRSSKEITTNKYTGESEAKLQFFRTPTYPFLDLGDDPETADRPESFVDWLRFEARNRKYFEEEKRDILLEMLQYLRGTQVNRTTEKDVSDDELRLEIMTKIGLYHEALAAEEEAA